VRLQAVFFDVTKTNSPNDLTVAIYQQDVPNGSTSTQITSQTVSAALITSGFRNCVAYFDNVKLAAGRDVYIVLRQTGTGSNTYSVQGVPVHNASSYIDALVAPTHRFIYGTGDNPAVYSALASFVPYIYPIFGDPAVDLISGAAPRAGFNQGFN
jgi:hypothetical protein